MRFELALIAGIVCFCCWCAYILINMNSTVAIPTQPAQPEGPAQANRQQQQQQYNQANQFQTNNNNNYGELIRQRQLQHGHAGPSSPATQMTELFATSAGSAPPTSDATSTSAHISVGHTKPDVAHPPSPGGYYTALGQGKLTSAYMQPPISTQGQPSTDNRVWHQQPDSHATAAATAQNYYPSQHMESNYWQSVNKQRQPGYDSWPQRNLQTQQEPVAEAQLSSGGYYNPSQEANRGARWPGRASLRGYYPAHRAGRADNPGLRQSYYGDEESESEAPTQLQEVAAGQQEGQPGGEDEEDTSQVEGDETQPEDTTTEERVGARSFSEHQLSANERDRHGRPITVHYNHLINGKPVPASSRQVADFESVVNELDPDQEEQEQQRQRQSPAGIEEETGQDDYDETPNAARSSMQSGESRLTGATARIRRPKLRGANERRGNDDYKLHGRRLKANSYGTGSRVNTKLALNKPRDSHQHRLSESLTAQQWDDDATSLPSSTTNSNNKNSITTSKQQDASNIIGKPSDDESVATTDETIETTTEAATPEEFVRDEEMPDDGADLFAGTDKFPFLDSADSRKKRKRRKRQVVADDHTRSDRFSEMQPNLTKGHNIVETKSITRTPVLSKLIHRLVPDSRSKEQAAIERENLQDPRILRNSPTVKRSTNELPPDEISSIQSDDSTAINRSNDQLRDSIHREIEEADRLSEKVGNENNVESVNNELLDRNQGYHSPEEYTAEAKLDSPSVFDLTDGMRAKDRDVADTLKSLEDLNIRVMADPSDSSSNADSQQSLVPAPPLPAPPWPPSSASSSNYQTGPPNQLAQNNYEHQQLSPEVAGPHHQQSGDYATNAGLPVMQNGHSSGHQAAGLPTNYPTSIRDVANRGHSSFPAPPLASFESHKLHRKKKKKRKISKGSKMSKANNMMKYKKAKAHKSKKSSKFNTAGMKKAKKKAKNKMSKSSKQFKGSTRGKNGKLSRGQRGAKKGSLYHKDKGYKKKGFKRVYKKMEAGDNKTYFDEFRDRDHNKKWKNHKDKYHYSQNKDWAGNDMKKYKDFDAHSMKDKKMGSGGSKENSKSNFKHDYKYKKGSKSKSSSSSSKKKNKKKEKYY